MYVGGGGGGGLRFRLIEMDLSGVVVDSGYILALSVYFCLLRSCVYSECVCVC